MEPILHLLIPGLFFMAVFHKIKKSIVIPLAFLAILPDFDIFIRNGHRVFFHNIFFMILIALILYFLFDKLRALIGFFFLTSHIILDLAFPGVPVFWPLYKNSFYLIASISSSYLDFNIFRWNYNFGIGIAPFEEVIREYPNFYMGEYGAILVILLLILFIILWRREKLNLKKIVNFLGK